VSTGPVRDFIVFWVMVMLVFSFFGADDHRVGATGGIADVLSFWPHFHLLDSAPGLRPKTP
jgi:hypothetical protein